MSFALYTVGFVIMIAGLIYGATLLHVPTRWIVVGTVVLLGLGISSVVATYAGWPTVVTPLAILLSTGVSGAVGLASGIYPAIRASGLDPIEALQHQ